MRAYFENHEGKRIEIGQDGVLRIAIRENDSKAQHKRREREGGSILWREAKE